MDPTDAGTGKPSADPKTDFTQGAAPQNGAPQAPPPQQGGGFAPSPPPWNGGGYSPYPQFPPQEFLRALSLGQVSGDMAILTMTVAALTPVLQSLFSLSAATSQRLYQANNESSQASLASLAAMALAAHKLLSPPAPQPSAGPANTAGGSGTSGGGSFTNAYYPSGTGPQSLAVT
ncbi:MAG TPA: hypothetical protein VMH86_06110 [Rhizomicrobium sp.]|nr:hypothetical protein [Rhizomicrobium sp.]